jgi:hypothetical protein
MRFIRLVKAIVSEIEREAGFQLWMSTKNYHPEYSDFAEFLRDARRYHREQVLSIKIKSLTDAEWEVYKQLHYR